MHVRSIRATIGLVFAALMLLGGLSVGTSLRTTQVQQHDALILNLAGRQRMLSQKLIQAVWLSLLKDTPSRHQAEIQTTASQFDAGLQALLEGGQLSYAGTTVTVPPATDSAFHTALEEVQVTWQALRHTASAVIESEPASPAFTRNTAELERLSGVVLEKMDAAVRTYQAAAKARVARLRRIQLAFLIAGSIVLALGYVLILLQVLRPVSALETAVRRTEQENLDAPVRIGVRNELSQLAQAFDNMRAQVKTRIEAESRYRGLFNSVPIGLYRSTPTGQILEANPALVEMLGYPDREALQAINVANTFANPEERRQWQTLMERQGVVRGFEMQLCRPDQTTIWVRDTARAVKDEQGRVLYYEGSLEDITERKQTEEALRESEARFRAVFEGAAIGIALTDLEGRLVDSNPALQKMHGYSKQEFRGITFTELTHPDDVDADMDLFRELVAGERDHYRMEKRYIREDGQLVWGRLTVSLVRDAQGEPQFTIAMVEDITERKQAEEAKRQLRERTQRQHEMLIRLGTHPALAEGHVEKTLPAIAEAAAEALEVERVNIWRLSADDRQLRCLEAFERSASEHTAGHRLSIEKYPNYLAALEAGLVVDATDVTTDPRTTELTADYWEPLGISSAIDAPVRLHGEVVGVVCHEHGGPPRAWTSDEITFARQIADLVAQTLLNADIRRRVDENARLLEAESQQRELAEALRDTAAALNSTLSLDEVLESILTNLGRVVPHDTADIMLVEPDVAHIVGSRGYAEHGMQSALGLRIPIADWSTLRQMAETRRPLIIPDTQTAADWVDIPEARWVRSYLGAPILLREEVVGFLNLDSAEPGFFTPTHAERLQTFANQAAVAIENARLFEEVQERAERMGRLASLSEALNRPFTVADVATAIGQGALTLGGADRAAVYRLNPDGSVTCPWAHGLSPAYVAQVTARAHEMPGGRLITSPEPILIPDVTALPEDSLIQELARTEGYRAVSLWPLAYEGREIAAASCYYDAPHTWSKAEQEVMEAFARQAAEALENARLFEALEARVYELSALEDVSTALRGAATVQEMGPLLATEAARLVQADAAFLCLLDEPQQRIVTLGVAGVPAEAVGREHGVDEGLTGHVVRSGTVYRSTELASDPLVTHRDVVAELGPGMCVPLRTTEGQVVGTLLVARRNAECGMMNDERGMMNGERSAFSIQHSAFTREEERLLTTLAEMAGNALQRAQAYEELEVAYTETVLALANAMDARDSYTGNHSQRLARWSVATAQKLECREEEIEAVRWGALLHDIGKIGVPDRILQKPGPLTDEERAIIERHPEVGEQIVKPVKRLAHVAPIIRGHQEHWDGNGYPDGLEGEAIPLAARILAVVDAYSAIIDERPYKEAQTHEEAVAELQRCAGTQFDPQAVEAFLQVLERNTTPPPPPRG